MGLSRPPAFQAQVLCGSTNEARLQRFRQLLAPCGVELLGPADLGIELSVVEDGRTPEENATKKASAYFARAGLRTFATDYALYIDAFPLERQPGILVARIAGRNSNATDAELLDYYAGELSKVGGESEASWVVAVALVVAPDEVFTRRLTERTVLRGERCAALTPGEPLNSLQFVPALAKYKAELTAEERAAAQFPIDRGVVEFVREHMS